MIARLDVGEKFDNYLGYLGSRWADEYQYENPKDYKDAIVKNLPDGIEMADCTMRRNRKGWSVTFVNADKTKGIKYNC